MRKFYTFLLLAAASIANSAADAKTFTITTNNPDQVIVRNPSDSYQPITWTGNSATVTVDDNSPDMPVQTQDGRRYLIASIVDESGNNVSTVPAEYFPLDGANLQISLVADGGTVTITTVEKEAKKFTFIGNPEQVKI